MLPRAKATLIVPAFNEADRLEAGFERLRHAAERGAVSLQETEVLYVDDGSTDETSATAEAIVSSLPLGRVLRQSRNLGKGAAVRVGVRAARSASIIFTDADMAIDPVQTPSLLAALDVAPVAVGSRAIRGHVDYGSWLRTRAGRSFNRLVRILSSVEIHDTQCGWKAARTAHAKILFHLTTIDRFAFDVELLTRCGQLAWPVREVPVSWKDVGGSHVRLARDSATMLTDLALARVRASTLPTLQALQFDAGTTSDDVRQACSDTALEAAPMLVDASGALLLGAALLSHDEAAASFEKLAAILPGTVVTLSIDDLAHATSIEPALAL